MWHRGSNSNYLDKNEERLHQPVAGVSLTTVGDGRKTMCLFPKTLKRECLEKDWNSADELDLQFEAKFNMTR